MKVTHFISKTCQGEKCGFVIEKLRDMSASLFEPGELARCGVDATHKVGEEVAHDDPNPIRHNLTAYVCCFHFARLVGRVCS